MAAAAPKAPYQPDVAERLKALAARAAREAESVPGAPAAVAAALAVHKEVALKGHDLEREIQEAQVVATFCRLAAARWRAEELSRGGLHVDEAVEAGPGRGEGGKRWRSLRRVAFDVLAELSGYHAHLEAMGSAGLFTPNMLQMMTMAVGGAKYESEAREAWHGKDQSLPIAARILALCANAARLQPRLPAVAGAALALLSGVATPFANASAPALARASLLRVASRRAAPDAGSALYVLPPAEVAVFGETSDEDEAAARRRLRHEPRGTGWRAGDWELELAAAAAARARGGAAPRSALYWEPAPPEAVLPAEVDEDTGLTLVALRNEPYVQFARLASAVLTMKVVSKEALSTAWTPVLCTLWLIRPYARGEAHASATRALYEVWRARAVTEGRSVKALDDAAASNGAGLRQRGNDSFKAGNLRNAALQYRSALASNGGDVAALNNLTMTWLKLGNVSWAVAFNNLTMTWLKLGNVTRATVGAYEVLQIEPDNSKAWYRWGECWARHKRWQLAQMCYKMALEAGATGSDVQGKLDEAMGHLGSRALWSVDDLPDDVTGAPTHANFRSWLHLPREAPKELADILEEALPLRSTSKFIACCAVRRAVRRARAERRAAAAGYLHSLPVAKGETWRVTWVDLGLRNRETGLVRHAILVLDADTGAALAIRCVLGAPRAPSLLSTFLEAATAISSCSFFASGVTGDAGPPGRPSPRRPGAVRVAHCLVGCYEELVAELAARYGIDDITIETGEEQDAPSQPTHLIERAAKLGRARDGSGGGAAGSSGGGAAPKGARRSRG